MHIPGHEAGADRTQYGLGFNVEHVLSLTGWSFSQVAEQMYPHHLPDGPHRLSARKGLAQVTKRKQKHWRRHLPALARAWNLSEFALLYDDLRYCTTLDMLVARYGFRPLGLMRR
jgi:hypothetical protein